jgi:acetylornithine deacetylase/succinyl-diaminopimelate desuccinylase-like protein
MYLYFRVDGKLYGRGSTDDKGPVLGWLHVIQVFKVFDTVARHLVEFMWNCPGHRTKG